MIFIYRELIKKYVSNLTINDIKNFADENKIIYTDKELNIIYNFIMNNYNELLDENIRVFEYIRYDISPELYKTILNLYVEYKQKYL